MAGAGPHEPETPARWPQLMILGIGTLLAMAPSFSASAVAPILRETWVVSPLDLAVLTVVFDCFRNPPELASRVARNSRSSRASTRAPASSWWTIATTSFTPRV